MTKTFLLFPFLLLAGDPSPVAPSLGWMLNAQRSELLRLDGVPGSVNAIGETLEAAERTWLSRTLLLQRRGESLTVRDLESGETRTEAIAADQEIAFSTDGRRFALYAADAAAPFVANDGVPHRIDGATAYTERDGLLIAATGTAELVSYSRDGDGWREARRVALPLTASVRALHWSGDGYYLLTGDGDFYAWRDGAAEARLVAREVRAVTALAAPGFFELECGVGPQLYYPASEGQKLYALPGAKASVKEAIAQ
jgi:hypothetical protein